MPSKHHQFDEIGYWSEIKLDIVKDYARAYSTIFSAQKQAKFHHAYVDAFAGGGINLSRKTGEFILGSPLNALIVKPPFREYYFVDIEGEKVASLRELVQNDRNVHVYEGDCNAILLKEIFPKLKFSDFRRALCLLDPYGLHLKWEVIRTAGSMKSIDMFLNFPIMDMNRNVLWNNPQAVGPEATRRMNDFWGDDSWKSMAYRKSKTLFGEEDEKVSIESIAEAFRRRLLTVAGFARVPRPLPMRNSKGSIVYYLFFASQKPVAEKIVVNIFKKYQERGTSKWPGLP